MVQAEDVLANEACGCRVNCCMYRCVRHGPPSRSSGTGVRGKRRGQLKLAGLRFQPLVEVFLRHDCQIRLHVVMSEAAELRTHNLVLADLGWCEVNREIESGHEVLLNAQLAD